MEHISIQGRTQRVIVRSLCHWNPENFYPCSDLHSQVALLLITHAVKKRVKQSEPMNDTFWIYAQMDEFTNILESIVVKKI